MLIKSFLDYLRYERNYSEKTVLAYSEDIKQLQEFAQEEYGRFNPLEVEAELIREWIVSLMDRGYTSTSVNRKLSSLRSFYKYLLRQGDFSASLLKVTGKRNKQRLIPFGDELRELMLGYINIRNEMIPERSEAFFVRENGERLYKNLVYNLVKRNLSKVVTLKKRSPHVLRHTFATTMLNNDAELGAVKELLGHESIATTEIYTHATFEELKKVYKQAHPRA